MPHYEEEDNKDLAWEKPAWTQGAGLKKTGKADKMKTDGNLAAPITSLPHQKEDGPFSKPGWTGDVEHMDKPDGDLAKPITALPHDPTVKDSKNLEFEKPGWTKETPLEASKKGEALKSGCEIARPIGGIKPVDA